MMILRRRMMDVLSLRSVRLGEELREIKAIGLPMRDRAITIKHLHLANHFIKFTIAECGHDLAHFFSNKEEEIDQIASDIETDLFNQSKAIEILSKRNEDE